jgi:GDP/UDP-N,N'-diacetylbacillosamine 2-epimerase (hydrolysing)
MRTICVITGTRAEYGLLKPVMGAVQKSKKLDLRTLVTGMHLSREFGYTIDEIIADGFKIDARVELISKEDSKGSAVRALGKGITDIAAALERINPDIVLVLGDRIEALAAALASAFLGIPLAHIHGGDRSEGGLDEATRHAITKFANLHFAATKESANRICNMGEDPNRVFVVGAPGLDSIILLRLPNKAEIEKKYCLPSDKPYILMVQHSISTRPELAGVEVKETLAALDKLQYPCVIIYPNADPGGRAIIKEIKEFEDRVFIRTFKNLIHEEYLGLLKNCGVLLGNSSSGIIEAPSFGIPVVNIGTRQRGRERADNVIDSPADRTKIVSALEKALSKEFRERAKACKSPYGDGHASERIIHVLESVKLDADFIQKRTSY